MKMDKNEGMIQFVNRAKQLALDLKTIYMDVHNQELAMKILCGLPSKFAHLIVASDAVADGEKLTLDFVKVVCYRKNKECQTAGAQQKAMKNLYWLNDL